MANASVWNRQEKFEETKSEALYALDVFMKLGAAGYAEGTRQLLGRIDYRSRE